MSRRAKHTSIFSLLRGEGLFRTPLLFILILSLAVSAFGTHISTAELQPEWSPAGQNVSYSVTFTNDASSADAIGEVRIYKNENYTDFVCDQKTGWILSEPAPGICNYYAFPQAANKIPAGGSASFTFSATTPEGGCEWIWQFETRDITFPNQGSINYLNDTTSVDDLAPEITKTLGTPQYTADGNTWITQNTPLTIAAIDLGKQCGISGLDYCEYKYTVNDIVVLDWTTLAPEDLPYTFNYEEDSLHVLDVRCYDHAGNLATHTQTEYVETQHPETTKTLGTPKYIDGLKEWITTSTLISLDAVDPAPHPSDVKETWYLNTLDESENSCADPATYCTPAEIPRDPSQAEGWTLYTGPFTKAEESCHVLTYFSVDNLGQVEDANVNCFFVDDTPPSIRKTIGDPKLECDVEGCDYFIGKNTPITLSCEDNKPHPSNNVMINYTYRVDEGQGWGAWSDLNSVTSGEIVFSFPET